MNAKTTLDQLVSRWHERQQRGEAVSVEDLCAGNLGQLDQLRPHLREVASMQAFLKLTGADDGAVSSGAEAAPRSGPASTERDHIPGYEILAELGRGGMGVVFKARQLSLKRVVALKTILAGRQTTAAQRARFRAEAEAVARLQHPGIVQIYEIGEHDGEPFFSMEHVNGLNLSDHLAGGVLDPAAAAALVSQIADATHYAHQQGIVHRDLKPGNILVQVPDGSGTSGDTVVEVLPGRASGPPGTAKITDFGLAKHLQSDSALTQSGAVIGTPSYMAPEQTTGRSGDIGPAVDTYALGAILYEVLTGRPPFRGATVVDTLYHVRELEPVPPSRLQAGVPRDLEVICLKCLQKEPGRRYDSARALADDLRRFVAGEPIEARPAGRLERSWRWCRRNPTVAGLATATVLSILASIVGVMHYAIRADAQAQQAQASAEDLRRALVRQHVATGTHYLETGNRAAGAWWHAKAWDVDQAEPEAVEQHRLRLGFTLADGPQLVGACFHKRPVLDAAFDRAGQLAPTRTDEPHAYLWDPFTARHVAAPLAHDAAVRAAAFNPAGGECATGAADGIVHLWDVPSGRLRFRLAHGSAVNAIAYREDGGLLAVATEAGAVHFWDPQRGEPAEPPVQVGAAVYHVAFSPTGKQVVTADARKQAWVWSLATGKAAMGPLAHADHRAEDEIAIAFRCYPVFSPDGATLATVTVNSPRRAEVTAWDIASGAARFRQSFSIFVHQLAFTPDGARLVALNGNLASFLDAGSGKNLRPLGIRHPRESQHACFRPDGKVLATCSTGGLMHLWDPRTAKAIDEPLRCADGVHALSYSADGRHFLAASHDGMVRVWRVDDRDRLADYAHDCGHADRIDNGGVRFSPDGRRELLVTKADAQLRDRRGPSSIALGSPAVLTFASFSPDGNRLLTQDVRRALRWWDASTGQSAATTVTLSGRLTYAAMSDDSRRLLTVESDLGETAGPAVTVWDVERGEAILGPLREWDSGPQRFGERALQRRISRAALSPDGTRLVLGSDATGMIGIWDVDLQRELARTMGYRGVLYRIRFTADGQRFLTNGSDTVARLWHTATAEPAGPPLRHPRFCRGADVGPDGWRVASVASDAVLRLWDGRTGDLLGRLQLPSEFAEGIWFSRDGHRLVVNNGKKVLRVPTYHGAREALPDLLKLLTGLQRESDDSLGLIDQQLFLGAPNRYRQTWCRWRGIEDVGLVESQVPNQAAW